MPSRKDNTEEIWKKVWSVERSPKGMSLVGGVDLSRISIQMLRLIQSSLGRDLDTLCVDAPLRPGLEVRAQIGTEMEHRGVDFAVKK